MPIPLSIDMNIVGRQASRISEKTLEPISWQEATQTKPLEFLILLNLGKK